MSSVAKTLLALLATLPAAHASTLILGDTSGNTRGTNAVDIQSTRPPTQPEFVASGYEAVAVGSNNGAEGDYSVALGTGNWAGGDIFNSSLGIGNETLGNHNSAVGFANAVYPSSVFPEQGSGAFGTCNYVDTPAVGSFAFGGVNAIYASFSSVFGSGITNSIGGSTMIGPSNTAKVTILSSGNVGIGLGNGSPTQKLDVGGNIRLTGNIINGSGATLALPSSGGTLITNTGNQTITGATTLQGTTTLGGAATAQQLKVDVSTGNVGVGTTPDAAAKLSVAGSSKFEGEVNVGTGSSTDGANLRLLASASDTQWNLDNNTGALRFFMESSPGVGTTERMRLTNQGYLGIGTSTPRNILDVVRNSGIGNSINLRAYTGTNGATLGAPTIKLLRGHGSESAPTNIGTVAYEQVGKINFSGYYNGFDQEVASIVAHVDNMPDGTTAPGALQFQVRSNQSWNWIAMTINSAGNVGVGVTTPQAKLDVGGTVQIAGDMKVKNNAVIRVSPAGDIAMAPEFQSGTNPAN